MYEPTLHTPLLMRYPPLIKAGSVQDKMALNLDYGATFLNISGIKIPSEVQGESLVPLMANNYTNWRTEIYYHYYEYPGWHSVRKHYGVRTETHKLMKFYGDDIWDYEMYDLVNDPNELMNIAGQPQFE
jgi:arylsulfatase A-like enzyme